MVLGLVAGVASIFYVKAITWADLRKPKGVLVNIHKRRFWFSRL